MTEEINIRKGTKRDYKRVEEILKAAYSNPMAPHSYLVDKNLPSDLAGQAAWDLWGTACIKSGDFFVALLDEEVTGFEFYFKNDRLSKILGEWYSLGILAVTPSSQGKGIGMKLVTNTIEHLKSSGAKYVDVGTDLDNIPAISCYERNGMRAIHCSGLYRFYLGKSPHPTTEPESVIRPVREGDYDAIKEIFLRSRQFDQLHVDTKIPKNRLGLVDSLQAERLTRSLVDREVECLVSLSDDNVVAFAALAIDPILTKTYGKKYGNIIFFAAHPDYRGHGLGSDLLKSVIRLWILPNRIEVTECHIPMNDWPAINVMHKCGFRLAHCSIILRSWY